YGYLRLDESGKVTQLVERTNPNKKWDWWVIGGRWSGMLPLKGPGPKFVNQARKGEVDFNYMHNAAVERAQATWNKANAALLAAGFPELGVCNNWLKREDCFAQNPDNIEAARQQYRQQPAVPILQEALKEKFFFDFDQFLT